MSTILDIKYSINYIMTIIYYIQKRSTQNMSYQEKRILTNIVTGALVLGTYCINTISKYQSGAVAQMI